MLFAISALAGQALVSSAPNTVDLQDRNIRIENLVDTSQSFDEVTRSLVVARLPNGSAQVEIDAETARRLIDNRIPARRYDLAFEGSAIFAAPAPSSTARPGICYAAARTIPADEIVTKSDVNEVPCDTQENHTALGYDRQSAAPVTLQPVSEGSFLGSFVPAREDRLRENAQVTLVTGDGGVTIRRNVTTLQPGREGRLVFVTTSTGDVFPVPFVNLEEE